MSCGQRRRAPWEIPWASVICYLTGKHPQNTAAPTAEEIAAAVAMIKEGTAPPSPASMAAASSSSMAEAASDAAQEAESDM